MNTYKITHKSNLM